MPKRAGNAKVTIHGIIFAVTCRIKSHSILNTPPCCMCTCIVCLIAQVRLICIWCMKICLRRAAHISAERPISVLTDMQTDKRYGYEYGCGYGKQVCIYTGLLTSRRSANQQVLKASKVAPPLGRIGLAVLGRQPVIAVKRESKCVMYAY